MLKIAICDNDSYTLGKTEELIMLVSKQKRINSEVEIYGNGISLVNDIIRLEMHFDVILLNVEMKEISGFEIAKYIRELDKNVLLIFMSANNQNLKDFFRVQTFDFFIKPISRAMIEQAITRAYKEICEESFFFEYKFNGAYYKIPIQDIIYFQSNKRIVTIVTSFNHHSFYGKLNAIEKHLIMKEVDFWRIHCSYLINSGFIHKLNYKSAMLKTGEVLNISGNRQKEIREKYRNKLDKINWIA